MRKKKDSLSLFTKALEEGGYTNPDRHEEVVDVTHVLDGSDIDNLDETDEEPTEEKDDPKVEEEKKPDPTPRDDDSPIPDNIINNINNDPDPTPEPSGLNDDELDDTNEQIDPNEATQVGAFFDAFAESLGWDVSEDEKPQSVDDIVDYIKAVVDQNSVPEYADERIARLDAYVKNGGKFEDFYSNMSQGLEYDSLDLEDESNQKAVVRDYLKMSGYDDESISRKIERYEDADMLEDEAADAIERLKMVKQQQLEEMQRQQDLYRQQQEQQSREFMTNLNNSIASLKDIRGIAVPKEDRVALLNYITKVDADGYTQYQKDFNSNMVNNLIESAYFTMKGDALLGEARRGGQTSAANKLRTMLRHSSNNHSMRSVNDDKQRPLVELASGLF